MRIPVELRRAYRLLNHGPTTLITSAWGGAVNVMAAAWVMPIDFEPPRLAAVIAAGTRTRELVESSGEFVVQLPTDEQAALTHAVGSCSGHQVDKLAHLAIATSPASLVAAPLIEGCVAWLECRVVREPGIAANYDLFVADVVAAHADDAVFSSGRWHFEGRPRTIHHIAGGHFFATGDPVSSKP